MHCEKQVCDGVNIFEVRVSGSAVTIFWVCADTMLSALQWQDHRDHQNAHMEKQLETLWPVFLLYSPQDDLRMVLHEWMHPICRLHIVPVQSF